MLYDFSSVIFSSKVNIINYSLLSRSTRPDVFCKKGVLRNFAACNFIKKETLAQVFSCQFCEISKNTFSYRTPLGECFYLHLLGEFPDHGLLMTLRYDLFEFTGLNFTKFYQQLRNFYIVGQKPLTFFVKHFILDV